MNYLMNAWNPETVPNSRLSESIHRGRFALQRENFGHQSTEQTSSLVEESMLFPKKGDKLLKMMSSQFGKQQRKEKQRRLKKYTFYHIDVRFVGKKLQQHLMVTTNHLMDQFFGSLEEMLSVE